MSVVMRYLIDFDRDFNFNDTYDDITPYVISANWELGVNNVEERVAFEGRATLTLVNPNNEFSPNSPENMLSNYHEKILPLLPVSIEMYDNELEEYIILWRGYTDKWEFEALENQSNVVTISCLQTSESILQEALVVPNLSEVSARDIINALVNSNKYTPPLTPVFILDVETLDNGLLILPSMLTDSTDGGILFKLFGFGLDSSSSLKEGLEQVAKAEQGFIFISREGRIGFKSYIDLITDESVLDLDLGKIAKLTYVYANPLYNKIIARYEPKKFLENTVLSNSPLELGRRERKSISLEIKPSETAEDGKRIVIDTITNVATDLGFDVSVRVTSYDSNTVYIEALNNLNIPVEGTLTVTGSAYVSSEILEVQRLDISSASNLRRIKTKIENLGLLSTAREADYFTSKLGARYSKPKGYFDSLELSKRHSNLIKHLTIGKSFNIHTVRLATSDIRHVIIGESGNWTPQDLTMTYNLDLNSQVTAFILDISELDVGALI